MKNLSRLLVVALLVFGFGAVGAVPAQAAVTGTIGNHTPFEPHWITVTTTWPPPGNTFRVYPKTSGKGKGFICGWNLYSEWGHLYPAGVWVEMKTTGYLRLASRK